MPWAGLSAVTADMIGAMLAGSADGSPVVQVLSRLRPATA
jgi:hypothetical protein